MAVCKFVTFRRVFRRSVEKLSSRSSPSNTQSALFCLDDEWSGDQEISSAQFVCPNVPRTGNGAVRSSDPVRALRRNLAASCVVFPV